MIILNFLIKTFKLILINFFIFIFVGIFFIYFLEYYYKLKNDYDFKDDVMFFGYQSKIPMMHTQDLYPYSNFHIQSDYTVEGEQLINYWPRDYYENMKYTSGANGFFTDFNFKNIKEKKENDFRIILTGGSGAQGWGASTNDKMFYNLLNKNLNQIFKNKNIEVINLSMGGSVSHENFITLNKWGHKVNPDLIISFSGNNDLNFPTMSGSDTSHYFYNLMGLLESTKTSNSKFKIFLANHFPNINQSPIGFAYNFLNIKKNVKLAKTKYLIHNSLTHDEIVQEYLDSIASIQRDFPNVPLILAIQPSTLFIDKIKEDLVDKLNNVNISHPRYESKRLISLYELTLKNIFKKNYLQKENFIDFNKLFLEKKFFTNQYLIDFCHLSDLGHKVIAEELTKIVQKIIIEDI